MTDICKRLADIAENWQSVTPGRMREIAIEARGVIERLQDAKRRALAIADERSRENVKLRIALKPFAAIGPDLRVTVEQVMAARGALQ